MNSALPNAEAFFATARERYMIKMRRDSQQPWPWTHDKIFQNWRFCNVFREDDKTTVWFRRNIRGPLCDNASFQAAAQDRIPPAYLIKIVESTMIFRWFNRIETGEIIKDMLLEKWDTEEARRRLKNQHPVVTGAYIIKGPDGYSKLDGVLVCIDQAIPKLPKLVDGWGDSLQTAWNELRELYYLGRFMSYELVSDLRWTPVLNRAEDIMTWANAGPGCTRGLQWVTDQKFNAGSELDQAHMLACMRQLLEMSKEVTYWPGNWPQWEMREVEHWLCEHDKYERAKAGNSLKRRFRV